MSANSEWGIYIEPNETVRRYHCGHCGEYTGLMHRRTCTDSDNNVHREFKIVCERCSGSSEIHWSKNLTEFGWAANNPNLREDYVSVSVDEMKKKG